MSPVTIRVPGKIHLIGEHTVVHGTHALIATIDKYVIVEIIESSSDLIELELLDFNASLKISSDKLFEKLNDSRELHNKYLTKKDTKYLGKINKNTMDYPLLSVAVTLDALKIQAPKGVKIVIKSEFPVGSGLGSSASLAVAVVKGLAEYYQKKLSDDEVFQIAFDIEKFKHGSSSGGDVAAVLKTGFILFQNKNGVRKIETLHVEKNTELLNSLYIVDSGKPCESTGDMVNHVSEFVRKNGRASKKLFNSQEKLVLEFVDYLKNKNKNNIIEIIKKSEKNLETLGVVSDSAKKIIMRLESYSIPAKISGAGGIKKGSGIILAFSTNKKLIEKYLEESNLKFYKIKLG